MVYIPGISELYDKFMGEPKPSPQEFDSPMPAPTPSMNMDSILAQHFGEAYWRFQDNNQEVQSKEHMIEAIRQSSLSWRCKNAFIDFVATYYDRNLILANLSTPTGSFWGGNSGTDIGGLGNNAEVEHIHMVINEMAVILINSYPSDRRKAEFMRFWRLIPSQVRLRLSRTTGTDRERILGARIQMKHESTQKVSPELLQPRG